MVDRSGRGGGRDERGGGSGEEPEYGWLYGGRGDAETFPGASGAGPRRSDPEPTQVLPTVPRERGPDADRPRSRPAAAAASSVPPPRDGSTAAPASQRPRRRRRPGRILLVVLLLWVVFLVAVPFWAWSKITKVEAEPAGARPAEQSGTTYLLVGSDSRKGLSKADNKRLGTGGVGDVGQRTDTILLLHTGRGPTMLLSIPRDSLVDIPGRGNGKINGAFAYGGPKLLVRTIEQNTGVRIDDYVEIGFGGFVNSVDAVGGVQICPTSKMKDPKANLDIKKGCQQADGVTALGYSRSRYTSALGDIDRAKHQREVVAGIGSKVKSPWTVLNPLRYFSVAKAGTSSLTVGKNVGPIALGRFALGMSQVGSGGLTCSMPIRDLEVHWDRERALALFKLIKQDRTADIPQRLCQPSGLAR